MAGKSSIVQAASTPYSYFISGTVQINVLCWENSNLIRVMCRVLFAHVFQWKRCVFRKIMSLDSIRRLFSREQKHVTEEKHTGEKEYEKYGTLGLFLLLLLLCWARLIRYARNQFSTLRYLDSVPVYLPFFCRQTTTPKWPSVHDKR